MEKSALLVALQQKHRAESRTVTNYQSQIDEAWKRVEDAENKLEEAKNHKDQELYELFKSVGLEDENCSNAQFILDLLGDFSLVSSCIFFLVFSVRHIIPIVDLLLGGIIILVLCLLLIVIWAQFAEKRDYLFAWEYFTSLMSYPNRFRVRLTTLRYLKRTPEYQQIIRDLTEIKRTKKCIRKIERILNRSTIDDPHKVARLARLEAGSELGHAFIISL